MNANKSNGKTCHPNYAAARINKLKGFARARQLLELEAIDDRVERYRQQRVILEQELGSVVLDFDDTCRSSSYPKHAELSPFEATRLFAAEMHRSLTLFASNIDTKCPPWHRYDPFYATPRMAAAIWRARQTADTLGIPYAFYAVQATLYLYEKNKGRLPQPSQFSDPEVATHVLGMWADPSVKRFWEGPGAPEDDDDIAALIKTLKEESEAADGEADPSA